MNGSIKYWKKQAKMNLSGHWGSAIAGVLAVGAVTFIGNILSIQLFPGSTLWPMVAGQVFVFVFSLIAMVFRAGYSYMLLNMARDREVSLGNLLYLFHNGPDRVLVAGFILSLLNTVAQLPFYYVSFIVKAGNTEAEQIAWIELCLVMLLVGVVLEVILTSPFMLTFCLIADSPEMGGIEALKTSARLMRGHILKYWLMMLSFIPLAILSLFSMYIGLLWLFPYIYMSETVFYMELIGTEPQNNTFYSET